MAYDMNLSTGVKEHMGNIWETYGKKTSINEALQLGKALIIKWEIKQWFDYPGVNGMERSGALAIHIRKNGERFGATKQEIALNTWEKHRRLPQPNVDSHG